MKVGESSKTYVVTGILLSLFTMSPLPWMVYPFIPPHIVNDRTGSHEPQQRTGDVFPSFSYWGMFATENYAPTTVVQKYPGSFLGRSTLDVTVE